MKLSLVRSAAAVALAAAALFAAPAAANAYTETPGPGETYAMPTVPAGVFVPGETVSILLSGEDANFASAGFVQAVYVANANIGSVTATSSGVNYSITLPSTASGSYSVLLTSPSNPGGYSASLTAGAGATGGGAGGTGLPSTGLDSNSLLGLWVGGGALVLAGGAVAVAAAVRRQRVNADA